jgi:hypothetical protein
MSSNSGVDVVPAYWYIQNHHKKKGKWKTRAYITKSNNRRAFTAVQELREDKRKCQAYYIKSRRVFIEGGRLVGCYAVWLL